MELVDLTLFKHTVNIYLKYCSGCNRMHQKMKCANVHSVKCKKPCRVQGYVSLEEMCVIIGVQVCMREEGDQVQKEKGYLGRGETFASMVGWVSPDLSHLPCGPESVQVPKR